MSCGPLVRTVTPSTGWPPFCLFPKNTNSFLSELLFSVGMCFLGEEGEGREARGGAMSYPKLLQRVFLLQMDSAGQQQAALLVDPSVLVPVTWDAARNHFSHSSEETMSENRGHVRPKLSLSGVFNKLHQLSLFQRKRALLKRPH